MDDFKKLDEYRLNDKTNLNPIINPDIERFNDLSNDNKNKNGW